MKKNLLKSSLIFGLLMMSFQVSAQELDVLKAQKEALELNKDLVKEQADNTKIKDKVEGLNRKADRKTDNFSSSDAVDTAKDAKKTAKLLKETESANKDLAKSDDKILDLQADIKKIEAKIERLKFAVEFKEK